MSPRLKYKQLTRWNHLFHKSRHLPTILCLKKATSGTSQRRCMNHHQSNKFSRQFPMRKNSKPPSSSSQLRPSKKSWPMFKKLKAKSRWCLRPLLPSVPMSRRGRLPGSMESTPSALLAEHQLPELCHHQEEQSACLAGESPQFEDAHPAGQLAIKQLSFTTPWLNALSSSSIRPQLTCILEIPLCFSIADLLLTSSRWSTSTIASLTTLGPRKVLKSTQLKKRIWTSANQ